MWCNFAKTNLDEYLFLKNHSKMYVQSVIKSHSIETFLEKVCQITYEIN